MAAKANLKQTRPWTYALTERAERRGRETICKLVRLPKPISAPCVLITPMRASPPIVACVAAMPTDMTRADEVEWISFGTVFELDGPKMKTPAHDRPGSVSIRRSDYYCSAPNAPTM